MLGKKVTLASVYVPRYVHNIDGCKTQAFLGGTIEKLTGLISFGKVNPSFKDIVIIHVGTNNINSNQSVDTIMS